MGEEARSNLRDLERDARRQFVFADILSKNFRSERDRFRLLGSRELCHRIAWLQEVKAEIVGNQIGVAENDDALPSGGIESEESPIAAPAPAAWPRSPPATESRLL